MCGIFGMVGANPHDLNRELLQRMGAALVHRGPDGEGIEMRAHAALGCRRLSIVDVAGGVQPLCDESGEVIAVCNGEIYNQRGLRADLEARGHRFRTGSDAEVIPHLYEERGEDFVHALEGMFAIAVWDERRRRLVLARDRMGEKPLYYASTPRGFLFASEPKALLAAEQIDAAPDWDALAHYLQSGYVASPRSALRSVVKLPPGGRLVLETSRESIAVDRYWEVAPLLAEPPSELTLDDAARALRARLTAATEAALMSDVPLGIFLSGGLDSTAVTALARSRHEGQLDTFAIRFAEPGFDEGDYAALAARRLGTRHHTLTISPELFHEGVLELARLLDEPLADPALVPTYLLAREARQRVKVVLVGEGSDELFAGYPTYLGGALAARYARLPAKLRGLLAAAAPALGAPRGNTTLRFLARRFLEEADAPIVARHRAWTGCFSPTSLATIATPGGPLDVASSSPTPEPAARTAVDALLALDLTGYLGEGLLTKVDRACMAASLEGRAPFMDRSLVELACRLPIELKLRGLETKRVLRRAVSDLVPREILRRQKRGLTVPLATWLAGPLRSFARSTLDRLEPGIVRPAAVRALLDEHVNGSRDNRRELWALIMFQLWREALAA